MKWQQREYSPQQMQQMQRGLNIVKGSNGKTVKVLKK